MRAGLRNQIFRSKGVMHGKMSDIYVCAVVRKLRIEYLQANAWSAHMHF